MSRDAGACPALGTDQQQRRPEGQDDQDQHRQDTGRRHARPGEQLQLFTGMRTRQCRLIGRAAFAGERGNLLPGAIGQGGQI